MPRAVYAILIEIACLGGLLVLSWSARGLFMEASGSETSYERGVFLLKDGTRIEAGSREEIESVQDLYRGRIKSATLYTGMSERTGTRLMLAAMLPLIGVTAYVVVRNRRDLREWMTLRVRQVVFGFAGGGGLLIGAALLGWVMQALGVWPEITIWKALRTSSPWLFGFLAVVLAPIGEELYFRGRLFDGVRVRLGLAAAIATTSIIFSLVHGIPALIPAYMLLGMALAALRIWSGGLWAPIIAHALNNGIGVLLLSE